VPFATRSTVVPPYQFQPLRTCFRCEPGTAEWTHRTSGGQPKQRRSLVGVAIDAACSAVQPARKPGRDIQASRIGSGLPRDHRHKRIACPAAWARVRASRGRRSACLTNGPRRYLAGRGFPRAVAARASPHPSPAHSRGPWACAGSSGRHSSRRAWTTCCRTFHRSLTRSRVPSSSPAINICRTLDSVTLSRLAVSRVLYQCSTSSNSNLTATSHATLTPR
jgi:hypothetical protein